MTRLWVPSEFPEERNVAPVNKGSLAWLRSHHGCTAMQSKLCSSEAPTPGGGGGGGDPSVLDANYPPQLTVGRRPLGGGGGGGVGGGV